MTHQTRAERWGATLRNVRTARGLSVNELARQADVDLGHLSKAERGLAGFGDEARIRIAAALGVHVQDIWSYPSTRAVS